MLYINVLHHKLFIKDYNSFNIFYKNYLPKLSNLYVKQIKRNFSKDASTIINEHSNRLEVKAHRWPQSLNFSYIWLRDHCRCDACYSKDTFQRTNDVLSIPLNIRPTYVSNNENVLHIQWPDGHFSKFDFQFLWENSFEGKRISKNVIKPVTWNRSNFPSLDRIKVPFDLFKQKKQVQKKLLENIFTYGIGIVEQVPPSVEATRETVEVISPVRRTFFGEMWAFQSDLEKADSAYSDEYLGSHTDTTYFSEASRLQIFHCLKPSLEGGESFYVDGFRVGEQLRKEDPQCYEYLSKTAFPCEYIGDDNHHLNVDTIFKHHPVSKRLVQFRFNVYDRAPLFSLPYHEVDKFYSSLQKLTKIVRNEKYEFQILLQPGQVVFIDNWRVMHGRKSYKGPRIMGGCYVENSDFTSKARTLGLKFD